MKKDITALFYFVHNFCKIADSAVKESLLSPKAQRKPTREPCLEMAEILTIILMYQQSPCKNFEYFYKSYLPLYKNEFKKLPSYNRFIELKPRAMPYLIMLLQWYCVQSKLTGVAYIDSTPLAVCTNKRISRNKVFRSIAEIGKTTKGWFYGLKLHLLTNEYGEIINLQFTRGNVDDRIPVPKLTERLSGLLFGDKGYIKQSLFESLDTKGLKLVTGIKSKMQNKLMMLFEKALLRKRSLIETVFSVLKTHFELEHTRHRSIWNAFVHLLSTLIAYCMKTNKPSIKQTFSIPN